LSFHRSPIAAERRKSVATAEGRGKRRC
jgi:hypothetical protein